MRDNSQCVGLKGRHPHLLTPSNGFDICTVAHVYMDFRGILAYCVFQPCAAHMAALKISNRAQVGLERPLYSGLKSPPKSMPVTQLICFAKWRKWHRNCIHLHLIASTGSMTFSQCEVSESIQEFKWEKCGSMLKMQLSI